MNKKLLPWIRSLPVTQKHIRGALVLLTITKSTTYYGCTHISCSGFENLPCNGCILHPDLTDTLYAILDKQKAHTIISAYLNQLSDLDLMEALI